MIPPSAGDAGSTDAPGSALDEVVDAIFRMFDGHIDAVAHAMAPPPPAEAPVSVSLVGAPAHPVGLGGALPHG